MLIAKRYDREFARFFSSKVITYDKLLKNKQYSPFNKILMNSTR